MIDAVLSRIVLASAGLTAVMACPSAVAAPVPAPPDTGSFDYQLGGTSDLNADVVVRDSTAAPQPGAYSICYVNGFQTQSGTGPQWLARHGDAVLRDDAGAPVRDPDWPDEYLLDPSTAPRRSAILDVLGPVIAHCADAGFDAVEIDNLDTFTRRAEIDRVGALDLARAYVGLAHARGLAAGQKNATELAGIGRTAIGFDFAIAEECAAYDECGIYTRAYGTHVLEVEYTDNLPVPFEAMCATPGRAPLTILRDRALTAAGTPGHVYRQCPQL